MTRWKVKKSPEYVEVYYNEEQWELLRKKREKAKKVMEILKSRGIYSIVHGSIARGDVTPSSDIDIFIPFTVPSYIVELALEEAGFRPYRRYLVQATPSSTPKAYIILDEEEELIVSFPLARLSKTEYEFYKFGGLVTLEDIYNDVRVPGVDKRLVLIEPTDFGHVESPVIGREGMVARKLGISVETVLERVRVLTRREEVGRTGVFLKCELAPYEAFESVLSRLSRENQYLRRVLRERG